MICYWNLDEREILFNKVLESLVEMYQIYIKMYMENLIVLIKEISRKSIKNAT